MIKVTEPPSVRKDFLIEVLKYANEKGTFTVDDLGSDLSLSIEEKIILMREIRNGENFVQSTSTYDPGLTEPYSLSFDGRYKLLEHEELEAARKASDRATRFAKIAISVSLFAILISIMVAGYESSQILNVNIKETEIDLLEGYSGDFEDIKNKIDSLQESNENLVKNIQDQKKVQLNE